MKVNLGIDQIRFIVRLPNVNSASWIHDSTSDTAIYKAVWAHILGCTKDWKKGAKHWPTAKGRMTKSVLPLDGGSVLTVALGWSSIGKYHFMTVQFNPYRLTGDAAGEMIVVFSCMFHDRYDEFFDRAECSYIEIPLDVLGAKRTDYLFFDTALRAVNAYYEADGTLYLGSRTSARYISIYDKAKAIADKGGQISNRDWLRIEARFRLRMAASKIAGLPNAFETVKVIDKKLLAEIKHSIAVNLFRKRVFEQRLQPQAAYRMAPDKKALLLGLDAAVPAWYRPNSLWKTFPTVARRITPTGLQAFAADVS